MSQELDDTTQKVIIINSSTIKYWNAFCKKIFLGIFGPVAWFSYAVEFQARGPPHIHLVISLKNHISSTAEVDNICKAVLPIVDPTTENWESRQELRTLVENLMIHRPCEDDSTVAIYLFFKI